MSCENPNLQSVPKDKEFRSLFTADKGNILLGTDLPQIELRIAAQYLKEFLPDVKCEIEIKEGKNWYEIK